MKENVKFFKCPICGNIITKNFMVDVVDITPPIISFSTEKYSYNN